MQVTVVACGESARHWIPRGITIGSNDVLKFGRDTDYLILANSPGKFKPERLNIIKKSKAKILVTSVNQWKPYFPACERIQKVTTFNKMIMKGYCQTSVTTPIMALSIAIRMGATEIIMWGVDLLNHKSYAKGTKAGDREIDKYKMYFKECERLKIKVWRGADGTAFDDVVPKYNEYVMAV